MSQNTFDNLLSEPVFSARKGQQRVALSLAGSLAALTRREVDDFTALRPHQRHAWHAFLVQIAAMALDRAGIDAPPDSVEDWEKLLLSLSDGLHEPWSLFVEDLSKPAFMQAPVPEGAISKKWKEFATPGELDVLVTSKNHDVKIQLVSRPKIQHWVYALVTLQTMDGFLGRGNYGISRMNGGLASRPSVSYAKDQSLSERFCHDLPLVLARRLALRDSDLGYPEDGGIPLVWLSPWDGTTQLSLTELDPDFIEICRRVRATRDDGKETIRFLGIASSVARIAAKELNG